MIYVYLLKDSNNKVIDIGQSQDPSERLYRKTKCKPSSGQGHFYGRTDITQEITSSHLTRKEARIEEERLKIYYGLEVTERTGGKKGGHTQGKRNRKLTFKQAEEIRAKYKTGNYLQKDLVIEYNSSMSAINRIINNKRYVIA